jgi:phage gpG-like protein
MPVGPEINVQLTPETVAVIERLETAPARTIEAAARGLNRVRSAVVTNIQRDRLSGQGPYAVEMHRLGQKSGNLRTQTYSTEAVATGLTAMMQIGAPPFYAGIHEFGGTFTRTSKPGKVRLAEDRRGNLLRQAGYPSLAVFARKGRKTSREVGFAGGKTFTVTFPARHSIGFGIADNLPLMTSSVEKEIVSEWQPKGGAQ